LCGKTQGITLIEHPVFLLRQPNDNRDDNRQVRCVQRFTFHQSKGIVPMAEKQSKKPYNDFPLTAHKNGQWCKKICGKVWFFGVVTDPDGALNKYLAERDEIHAGRDPRRGAASSRVSPSELTVAELCNLFLHRQWERSERGEITKQHFEDCVKACKRLVDHIGRFHRATAMTPTDFAAYKATFPKTWGAEMCGGHIQKIRSVFRWAAEAGVLPSMPAFGLDFRKPTSTEKRRERQKRQALRGGRLDFSSTEAKLLVSEADGWLRACILLGLNAGFGNADCGRLSTQFFDVESGWYDLPREKTGIERRFPLWPETAEAIREAMRHRPIARSDEHDKLCFLTSHGKPVIPAVGKADGAAYRGGALCQAFTKLAKRLKIDRSGRGFYSLRRTFETVAGESRDQPAVDLVMGHADVSMAAVYRQGISDARLVLVTDAVRSWLFNS
jgi:integrase